MAQRWYSMLTKTEEGGLPELQSSGNISSAPRSIISNFMVSGGSSAYYVLFNPSSLSTIASAAGKLLPYLSSTITGLMAFFAANSMNQMSQEGQVNKLLTPKQLSVLLGLLVSGWHGLWDAICYRVKRGSKFDGPLFGVVTILTITTILGLVIPIIDTWFGFVVIPSEQTQLQINSPSVHSFGRGLISSDCTQNGTGSPCNVITAMGKSYLVSASEAFKVLHNASTINKVNYFPSDQSQAVLYLGDAASSSNLDFKASTFAVSTQCQPITYDCTHMHPNDSKFNCTPALTGDFNTLPSPVGVKLFSNSSLTRNLPFTYQNPLYFATWAVKEQVDSKSFQNDPGVAYHSDTVETLSWILNCSSTVYEATYTWVNGTVTSFNTTLANSTLGGIMSGPFGNDRVNAALQCSANFASAGNSSAEIAEITAAFMSRAVLSLSVGAISSRKNIIEQSRSRILLTRVPVVPFYLLITLKALYVCGIIILAAAIVIWSHPKEAARLKSQFTIDGLVGTIFREDKLHMPVLENSEEMENGFQKSKEREIKVALLKRKEEWSYATVLFKSGEAVIKFV
ncbi:hypothetical protein N5P37_009336 [Trichoderma harzianum]|nr:hypothetical protein N5P37_009336 [Trichoderma harzianum]